MGRVFLLRKNRDAFDCLLDVFLRYAELIDQLGHTNELSFTIFVLSIEVKNLITSFVAGISYPLSGAQNSLLSEILKWTPKLKQTNNKTKARVSAVGLDNYNHPTFK